MRRPALPRGWGWVNCLLRSATAFGAHSTSASKRRGRGPCPCSVTVSDAHHRECSGLPFRVVKNIVDGPIICIAAYTLSRKKCVHAYFRSKGKFLKGEIVDFCKVMWGFGRKRYGRFFFRRCAYCLSRVFLSESEKEIRPVLSTSCRATSGKSLLFSRLCK